MKFYPPLFLFAFPMLSLGACTQSSQPDYNLELPLVDGGMADGGTMDAGTDDDDDQPLGCAAEQ